MIRQVEVEEAILLTVEATQEDFKGVAEEEAEEGVEAPVHQLDIQLTGIYCSMMEGTHQIFGGMY